MSPISLLPARARSRPSGAALWAVVVSGLALCTLPASAEPGPSASPAPAVAALRVDRDPVTGTLTPAGPTSDPMLMPLWASSLRPALDRLTAVQEADGSMMVDLTGIYLDFATAHREWDGRVAVDCDASWVPEVLRPIATPTAPALGWAER